MKFKMNNTEWTIEEVDEAENAHHVADVKIRPYRQGKGDNIHFELSEADEVFDTQHYYGHEDHVVDPHGVVLHYDRVRAQRVHG